MSINMIKEEIKTDKVICQKYSQTMVESDVIVPDVNPDIKKILEASGIACITQKMIQPDKILLRGNVHMTVLYVPDGTDSGKIKSLSSSSEFSHTIDCRGITPDMQLSAEIVSLSFDTTLINSRKLSLRCTIGIGAKVSCSVVLPISTDIENNSTIALKKEPLRLISETGTAESQIILRQQLELSGGKPPISEVLRVTAVPSSTGLDIMDGKAVAKGQVKICMLYTADTPDEEIQFMEYMLPFTEILDISEIAEGMDGEIDYNINDMYYEVRDDSDGELRNLGIELVLSAIVKGSELYDINAITDAYSLSSALDCTSKTYHIEQLLDNSTAELTHKDQAKLPPMLPAIGQVCDIGSGVSIDRISAENDHITVYGTIHTSILYLSDDADTPVSEFNHNTEFSHEFAVSGAGSDTTCDAEAFMEDVSYTLTSNNSLDLRFVLGLSVKSLKTGDVVIVDELSEYTPDEQPKLPSIVIYFVQKGDTLWNIAKRYRTTVDSIKSLNSLESDTIYPGQKIKITSADI